MADAEVGDDAYGEDPTVRRLESLAAALLGKEAALYVPSGTMANQVALRTLGRPGTEVLCAARAHVYRYERAAAGGQRRRAAAPAARRRRAAARSRRRRTRWRRRAHQLPRGQRALRREHAHARERASRRPRPRSARSPRSARVHGLPVHCDGARIWNAAVALGEPPSALTAGCDTVMFCLSKGLGAPVGSVLCGERVAHRRGARAPRPARRRMRQAGVIAAAGIVALETMVERLADDHARARRLADALAERVPRQRRSGDGDAPTSCARRPRRSRPTCSIVLAADGRAGRRASTPTPCGSSPTRTSTTPASTGRSPRCARSPSTRLTATFGRMARARRPPGARARRLRASRRPRDLGRRHAGALGRRPAPRCGCWSRPAATRAPTIPTPIPTRSPPRTIEETAKAAALLGFAGHRHLEYPDGELDDDPALRADIVRVIREVRPEVVLCPDPDRGVLRRQLLQPPRPPGHRMGDARRGGARGRQPALLPGAHRRRARGAPGARSSTCRARSSPTAGSTSATPSSARSTRLFCHASQLPDAATGSATSSASAPRRPAGAGRRR